MKLSQTLAGTRVITAEHPDEKDIETHLAEFDMTSVAAGTLASTALEDAAAAAFFSLCRAFPLMTPEIRSHDPEARARMTALVVALDTAA